MMTDDFKQTESLHALLTLNVMASGQRKVLECLIRGMNPPEILDRIRTENFLEKQEILYKTELEFSPAREIESCEKQGIQIQTLFDAGYPERLKQIFDPPFILYTKGIREPRDDLSIAVVGSRHPNLYGRGQTRKFCRDLAKAGMTVVSGFARGVDQEAHKASLQVRDGRTIAVMGCGLDRDYPRGSLKLKDEIAERGVLISEYPLGAEPYARNFPRRNRIISGLSMGVLVVQAHRKSGSLITAHEALEQGRFVFAVPGPVEQIQSRGTHALIREGASLVENAADIVTEIMPWLVSGKETREKKGKIAASFSEDLFDRERGVDKKSCERTLNSDARIKTPKEGARMLDLIREGEGLTFEEILKATELTTPEAASILMKLQLAGHVKKSPDGRFALS